MQNASAEAEKNLQEAKTNAAAEARSRASCKYKTAAVNAAEAKAEADLVAEKQRAANELAEVEKSNTDRSGWFC